MVTSFASHPLRVSSPCPCLAPYVASKHAVDGLARTLRVELAPTGTKVGVGYFGVVDTDMARNTIGLPALAAVWASFPRPLGSSVPVGHAGRAVVRGIERRANWVYTPRWMWGVLLARHGLSEPMERLVARRRALRRALRASSASPPTPRG